MSKDSEKIRQKPLLIVSHGFPPEFGGMEQFAGRFSVALHDLNCNLKVLTTPRIYDSTNPKNSTIRPYKSNENGFTVLSIGKLRKCWIIPRLGFIAAASYFASLLFYVIKNHKRYRGIIVFGILRDFSWLCLLKKIIPDLPLIGIESSSGELLEYRTVGRRYVFGTLYQYFIKSSSAKIVAFGQVILDEYRNLGFSEDRLIVIPNGITPIKNTHPYNPNNHLVVAVGRLSHEKGYDILIDAFAKIKSEDARLIIHGTGPEKSKLETQVKNRKLIDRVTFSPSSLKLSIADIFEDATVGVVSSRIEGMSSIQLESMYLGIPMVVSDVGCNAEVFNLERGVYGDDGFAIGEYGLLVPAENSKALARAIDFLIKNKDLRLSISKNVKALFDGTFDISKVAQRYSDLLS